MKEALFRRGRASALAATLASLAGCGVKGAPQDELEWRGSELHFSLDGTVNGRPVAIEISGAPAEDRGQLKCGRRYCVDPEGGKQPELYLIEINARGALVEQAVPGFDKLQLSLVPHDFHGDSPGSVVPIVAVETTGAQPVREDTYLIFTINNKASGQIFFTNTAQRGTFVFQALSGQRAATGMIPDEEGTFGGVIQAEFSVADEVFVSFSAKCEENHIEYPPHECVL